jgi:hypothetical protein
MSDESTVVTLCHGPDVRPRLVMSQKARDDVCPVGSSHIEGITVPVD